MNDHSLKSIFLLITLLISNVFVFGDGLDKGNATPGTVSFTVKTVTAGGNYAPKHVLAIWIEKDGVFVKTRKAMANQRKQYLYTWRASSNYNVVDAITGSTINSHQTHTIEWDCSDLNGNIVPDGNYTLKIEFTDKHAQGPLFSIDFMKGTEAVVLTPPNQTNFINMSFSYTPQMVALADFTASVTEACTDQIVTFTSTSTGATSWNWNFGEGANPLNASGEGPHNVSYAIPGPKTISLTINGNVVMTKTDMLTVAPNALADFSYMISGNAVSFANSSQNAFAYNWDFGDGTSSTEQNPMHTYAANGTYDVILTAQSQSCDDDVNLQQVMIDAVGISELRTSLFEISPNPASNEVTIVASKDIGSGSFKLVDANGRLCMSQKIEGLKKGESIRLDIKGLNSGTYFIELNAGEKPFRRTLVIL